MTIPEEPTSIEPPEPEPPEPFVELTQAVWRRWPDHAPYGGAHREIVPHLTVAVGAEDFYEVRAALEPHLPLRAAAREEAAV